MSHAVDSSNLNSLFLVSVTCLHMPKELHFHHWLLWTPVPAGRAGKLERLPSSSLPLPSLPPQRMKKTQRCHFNCTDLLVVGVSFLKKKKNYVVDKLEEILRQVVLNGSYCGSLKCEPVENDRDTYCIHKHCLSASETKPQLRQRQGTIQRR